MSTFLGLEADFSARLNNTGGPLDRLPLAPEAFHYLPARIGPQQLLLVQR